MILTFDEFTKANEILNSLINDTDINQIETELNERLSDISSDKKTAFLNHLNSLFLNVMLNRLDELGPTAKEKSIKARAVISSLINS